MKAPSRSNSIIFAIWTFLVTFFIGLIVAMTTSGCAAATPPPAKPKTVLPSPGQTPPELKHVATGLDWIILISVIVVGVGTGMYFFAPTIAHSLSWAIMGTSAAVEGSALITRVSLWFVPWIAIGLAVIAVGLLAYGIYRNRVKLGLVLDVSSPLPPLSSTAAPIAVQINHT